ncbi:MAG: YeeE/YedE family protein [Pseudomonadota bacterium]|nr:YeeE/YedE family protein [Pseudomonadota bacterium]
MDNPNTLLWLFFALGAAFGVAARASRFCLLRGLTQARGQDAETPRGSAPALQAFALALAVAITGTQALAWTQHIDLSEAVQMRARFSPLGMLAGGVLFGAGMALARACGARSVVLLAGGNLRALLTLLCLGLAAQAAMTGVLAPARQWLQGWGAVTLAQPGAVAWGQGALGAAGGALVVGVPVLALLAYALRHPALRRSPVQWLGALAVGALVALGWWLSTVGADPFDERRATTSISFIGPVAESLLYLQLAVGRPLGVGAALVAGVLAGALMAALAMRTARWESFDSPARTAASAVGGALMGFGGVVAVGCSVGQGLSGLSTLAWASVPAVAGIVLGALAVLQWRLVRQRLAA